MNNEDQKLKYKQIIDNLTSINQKIDTLSSNIKFLNLTIQNSLMINNHGIEEKEITNIEETLKDISTTINDNIIPSLQAKINN